VSDVVSGLLAKLEAVEQEANEGHSLGCSSTDPCYEPPYEDGPDYGRCDCRQQLTFRLCRAHRDIIEAYVKHVRLDELFRSDPDRRGNEGHLVVAGVMSGLQTAVEALARGLGVEEQGSE
jgi:hypothetical protein